MPAADRRRRLERLAYTGRYGSTVLLVLYKLHEGSIAVPTR